MEQKLIPSIQRSTEKFQAAQLSEVGNEIDIVRGPVGSISSPIFNWILPIDEFVSVTDMKITELATPFPSRSVHYNLPPFQPQSQ
jgi:hypothetical protein